MASISMQFQTDLGVTVTVNSDKGAPGTVIDMMRYYGARGWSTEVPNRGFLFPLENHDDFDWAIIGARVGKLKNRTNNTVDEGVWHRGKFYKRRDLEPVENPKKNISMPAAIKYSRGASELDQPEIVEVAEGEFKYVTLVFFKGGRRDESLAEPKNARAN
jgi:DdrB-like protein